jgi:hypothetical protein
MRFLIVLIIVILLVWKFWPQQPVPSADESFIGPQLQPLRKAEKVEDEYLEAVDRQKEQIEKQADGG